MARERINSVVLDLAQPFGMRKDSQLIKAGHKNIKSY